MSAPPAEALQRFASIVPPLDPERHKGQAGRIGVLGGSPEYTGAPFFASSAALRAGADLAYVFCHADAAPALKTYSAELIVLPVLSGGDESSIVDALPRLHALLVGPGLGRDKHALDIAARVIEKSVENELPLIIDADGLYLVATRPELLRFERRGGGGGAGDRPPRRPPVVLTPNVVECERLQRAYTALESGRSAEHTPKSELMSVERMCALMGGGGGGGGGDAASITFVEKGASDRIYSSRGRVECDERGSPRRCGGQGDVLAGLTAVCTAWAAMAARNGQNVDWRDAAYAASFVTRRSSATAFARRRRAMLASDVLDAVGDAFEQVFPACGDAGPVAAE